MRVLISLILLTGLAFGQVQVDRQGNIHAKRQGRTQAPKEIVDTLRLSSGFGHIVLSEVFHKTRHTTKPTEDGYFYGVVSQKISDTSQTVNSYATYLSANNDTLIVKSSSATDSSLVVIRGFIK